MADGVAHEVGRIAGQTAEAVGSALDTSLVRGTAAVEALRGGPVRPPVGARRWPWAVVAAVAGAAAGAAIAVLAGRLAGRLMGQDAPDAQDPEDVQAVVDRPGDLPAG